MTSTWLLLPTRQGFTYWHVVRSQHRRERLNSSQFFPPPWHNSFNLLLVFWDVLLQLQRTPLLSFSVWMVACQADGLLHFFSLLLVTLFDGVWEVGEGCQSGGGECRFQCVGERSRSAAMFSGTVCLITCCGIHLPQTSEWLFTRLGQRQGLGPFVACRSM